MRNAAVSFASVLGLLLPTSAHAFTTEMLVASGDSANRIDLVIMGDGYRTEDQAQLTADARRALDAYFAQPVFSAYRAYFNVKLVHVVSKQTGADNGSAGGLRDTALGAFYNCQGVDRLLCVDSTAVMNAAATDAPEFDLILVLVNDIKYGGSGGSIVVSSIAPPFDIPVHETGHSLFGLADEYAAANPGFPACSSTADCREPNVTLFTNRTTFKWGQWVDAATPLPTPDMAAFDTVVGAFQGARYLTTGIYRPRRNACIMRVLNLTFCEVCTEAGVVNIYSRVDLIDKGIPSSLVVIGQDESIDFQVVGPKPMPSTLTFSWSIDGRAVAQNDTGILARTGTDFGSGTHKLTVTVSDRTTMVRRDPQQLLTNSFTWDVTTAAPLGGFPTKDANDGKFCTVTGQPLATVQNQNTQFLISVATGQTAFKVQVFDGDQAPGSLNDHNEPANPAPPTARTCYDLYSSRDKATPDTATPAFRVDSSTLPDANWGLVYSGNVFGQASGSGAHFYILDIYLTDGACGKPFRTISAGVANAFKVRATGQVSTVASDFAFLARDLVGPFAVDSPLPESPMVDTTYDGQFRFFIDVGAASKRMILRDADADVLLDDDPAVVGQRGPRDVKSDGIATGASADIQYQVFDQNGQPTGVANTNPSGNNDGINAFDVEEIAYDVSMKPGTWEWRWSGVHVENNVRIWAPFGSPSTFEIFGEPATRISPSGARPRSYWTTADLGGLLPITLGTGTTELTISDSSTAAAVLSATDVALGGADARKVSVCHRPRENPGNMQLLMISVKALPAHLLHGDDFSRPRLVAALAAELLAAKLNVVDGVHRSEDLLAAFVYSRTLSVRDVIAAADAAIVTGEAACGLTSLAVSNINDLITLLRALNQAEVTYAHPDPDALLAAPRLLRVPMLRATGGGSGL